MNPTRRAGRTTLNVRRQSGGARIREVEATTMADTPKFESDEEEPLEEDRELQGEAQESMDSQDPD